MVSETSIEAYNSIINQLGLRQMQVYEAIKRLGEADNLSISKHLNLPINCVTGRVNELRKDGLIELAMIEKSIHTGRRVSYWRVKV